jgi:hypothetical protein
MGGGCHTVRKKFPEIQILKKNQASQKANMKRKKEK